MERDSITCGLLYDPSSCDPPICVSELKIATHVAVVARLVDHVAAICIYVLIQVRCLRGYEHAYVFYAGST